MGCEVTVQVSPPLTREGRRSLALHAMVAERLNEQPEVVLATPIVAPA